MKVGFFQYDVIWRNRDANLSYIESKIKGTDFDLLVLPEFFTCGYAFETKKEIAVFAEYLENSPTVDFLAELMKGSKGLIVGAIPEIKGKYLFNTQILVGQEGLVAAYQKIHITDYEKRAFQSGSKIQVTQTPLANIGLMTCFDAWFAPLCSSLNQQGAQIISHSACFGGQATAGIIPIRALENQCFVVSCNRIGTEKFQSQPESYCGQSQIVSPDGKILAKAGKEELLQIVDIDLSEVGKPRFGSLICKDFKGEHAKYHIHL